MKHDKKIKLELTQRQAQLISWALTAGLDQYEKHLMHDDWDDDSVPKFIINSMRKTQQQFKKAIILFNKKYIQAF